MFKWLTDLFKPKPGRLVVIVVDGDVEQADADPVVRRLMDRLNPETDRVTVLRCGYEETEIRCFWARPTSDLRAYPGGTITGHGSPNSRMYAGIEKAESLFRPRGTLQPTDRPYEKRLVLVTSEQRRAFKTPGLHTDIVFLARKPRYTYSYNWHNALPSQMGGSELSKLAADTGGILVAADQGNLSVVDMLFPKPEA